MMQANEFNVHGPVRMLRTELAEWDATVEDWQAPRTSTRIQFGNGKQVQEIETRNSNGSICRTAHDYDGSGRLVQTTWQLDGGPVGKTTYAYDTLGRITKVVTVLGDGVEHETARYAYDELSMKTKMETIAEPSNAGNCDPGGCGTMYGVEGAEQAYGANSVALITTFFDERDR